MFAFTLPRFTKAEPRMGNSQHDYGEDSDGSIRIPQWGMKVVAALFIGLTGFGSGYFVSSLKDTQNIEDRLSSLEKDNIDIHRDMHEFLIVQQQNSEFREAAKVKLAEIDEIKHLLLLHMGRDK
ncbi:MAG: hypothetical protein ABSH08_22575 [Tepidisphaeraceae bacterium]|jgi:hypothetical protein